MGLPKDIVGIDSPATGREIVVRDSYDAETEGKKVELEKKRAERAAKPGKLFLSVYRSIPYPDGEHVTNEQWSNMISELHKFEKTAKGLVRDWAKEHFPEGKIWVGDVDSFFVERHVPEARGRNSMVGANVKLDWSYLDEVRNTYGTFIVTDNAKEVRLIIPIEKAIGLVVPDFNPADKL